MAPAISVSVSRVSRVPGPGRLQGRALEHGLVAALSKFAKPREGIQMRHRDGTPFFTDKSKEARQYLRVMKIIAADLCASMNQDMRHKTARSKLSRRAFALAIKSVLAFACVNLTVQVPVRSFLV